MSAAHRGKPDNSWLIALAAVLVVPLAVIGLIMYLRARHLSGITVSLAALDGVMVIQAAHRVVMNLADKQLQSAEELADRFSLIAQLIGALVLELVFLGQVRGTMHGTFRDATGGVIVLYLVGSPIYWLGGKRRLVAMLRTRAAGDRPGS
jgi:hypothetical protein